MQIDAVHMRLVWATIETIPCQNLLDLTDTALVKTLLQQIANQISLSSEEIFAVYDYLGSRVVLIRDIAESRQLQTNQLLKRGFIAKSPCLLPSLQVKHAG